MSALTWPIHEGCHLLRRDYEVRSSGFSRTDIRCTWRLWAETSPASGGMAIEQTASPCHQPALKRLDARVRRGFYKHAAPTELARLR